MACLMEILEWPEPLLQRALPKAPARVLACLATAYPRAAGRTLVDLVRTTCSHATVAFLQDEITFRERPSYEEIRRAEAELLHIIRQDNVSQPAQEFRLAA